MDRNHPIRRIGHAAEHTGRGFISIFQGNLHRASEEFKRAGSNFGNVENYPD